MVGDYTGFGQRMQETRYILFLVSRQSGVTDLRSCFTLPRWTFLSRRFCTDVLPGLVGTNQGTRYRHQAGISRHGNL